MAKGVALSSDRANDIAGDTITDAPLAAARRRLRSRRPARLRDRDVLHRLHAMRTGLLTRFWGSLGMALGAVSFIFFQFALLWFVYLGLLLARLGARAAVRRPGQPARRRPGRRPARKPATCDGPTTSHRIEGEARPRPRTRQSLESVERRKRKQRLSGSPGAEARELPAPCGRLARLRWVRISLRIRSRRGSCEVSTWLIAAATAGWIGGDPLVHRLGDGAVGRVALAAGAQLDQVHRLARVEVERVADPVGEAERVGRLLAQAGVERAARTRRGRSPAPARTPRRRPPPGPRSGTPAPRSGPEPLPLAGQHPVALQVAEGAVVGDDLEAVAQRLEAAAGAVAAVGAARRPSPPSSCRPLVAVEHVEAGEDLGLRRRPPTRTGRRRAGPLRCRRRGSARPRARPRRRRGGRGRAARPSPRSPRGAARR